MTPDRRSCIHRILVIDDHADIHEDVKKILGVTGCTSSLTNAKAALFGDGDTPTPRQSGHRFQVDAALQGEEGFKMVEAAKNEGRPYSLVLVDMRMPPGWDGVETIRHIWACDPDVQTVICTAYSDYSLDQILDQLGSSDRLLILKKPFDTVEILQLANALCEKWILHREAAVKMDQLERMVQERTAQIEHAMLHDKLTGLGNRTLLAERLAAAIERRRRHPDYRFAVLFLDFDRFKLINDSLGHEVGDLLLIEISSRLTSSLRATDMISHSTMPIRVGGDEFIVLLDDYREEPDAARVAQRLLDALSVPYLLNAQKLHLTASMGIATSERDYQNPADIIRDADTAMYRAKARGRARFVMFDANMHEEVATRLDMENAMRKAMHDSEFLLHYQPIVRLDTGRVTGFEALLRWNHAERGTLSAAELIPIAEETGIILPLGLWVLREACTQLCAWRKQYPEADRLVMSINLSRRQLLDPELVNQIHAIVSGAGLPRGSLVLEITESTVLEDPIEAIKTFERIKDLGIWLHLDDFGTGHSSISCLYQFPLAGMKIDRAFLRNVLTSKPHAVVLEAIISMARAFDLQIIAEGVETEEQADFLRRLGVGHAQGFYFGRPTDPASAEKLIQSGMAPAAKRELAGVAT